MPKYPHMGDLGYDSLIHGIPCTRYSEPCGSL